MTVDTKKTLNARVVLLKGEEEALRRRALATILEAAEVDPDDFDYASFAGDGAPPVEWIGAAMTSPFMAPRRVVVVRNALRADPKDFPKETGLASLPASALLILVADDEAGSEDRARKLAANATALAKLVEGAKGLVLDFKPDPKSARAEINAELTRLGRKMTPKATETLLEMCGGSLSRALDELEKIVLFTGKDPIPEEAVAAVTFASPEWSIWKLVDAVSAGNPGGALDQLKRLLGSGKKAESAALESVLPQLSRTMRLVWQARLIHDRGGPEASRGFPEKNSFAKEKEYRQGALRRTANTMTLLQIASCLRLLADADAGIKGLGDTYSTTETLETTVLKMCSVVKT